MPPSQANASPPVETPDTQPLTGLVRTHWMLALCVVCGHERVHGERHYASCPSCGAALHSFALYRDLSAGQRS
jgi:rubrerythrin